MDEKTWKITSVLYFWLKETQDNILEPIYVQN